MNQRKESSQRVLPSFDVLEEFEDATNFRRRNLKRVGADECNAVKKKRAAHSGLQHKNSYSDPKVTWIEKYSPQTKDDLAVHKKKVLEVEEWLIESLKKSDTKQGACLLLLTGPPGVGKTATIHVLCRNLNLELTEWTNSTPNTWNPNVSNSMSGFPEFPYETQATTFRSFLLRANRYPPLFSVYSGRIVLVEEFPNAFLKETATFHEILRKFRQAGRCPLIFIVSDSRTGASAEYNLFPKDLQSELGIKNISFNPIAPTMLLKVLNRINMDTQDSSKEKLSKTDLETVASECMGDIRNAINTLQFLKAPRYEIKMRRGKASSIKESSQQSSVSESSSGGKRDTSLFLFHALGKILYCKRDKTKKVEEGPLPAHLSHFSREPLLANPEEVYNRTSISEESFILFLHQNYLAFIEDIEVAAECSAWLSESETLTVDWSERYTMNSYATSLASRGLMFNLVPSSSGNKWRPLHKPQYFNSTKDSRQLCQSVKYAFKGKRQTLRELQVDFIPYLPKISGSCKSDGMRQIVDQMGVLHLRGGTHRYQSDSLSEKELYEVNLDDVEHYPEVKGDFNVPDDSKIVSEPYVPDISEEEEFVIEECDI